MGEQEALQLVEITWSEGLVAAQTMHGVLGLLLMHKRVARRQNRRGAQEVVNRHLLKSANSPISKVTRCFNSVIPE
jgi:hypothetical protein